uniref:Uncharacterized protein n=1 Tax=Microcebus murinus TaxID=30608 RepID=A0A8C5Y8S4_MICMU
FLITAILAVTAAFPVTPDQERVRRSISDSDESLQIFVPPRNPFRPYPQFLYPPSYCYRYFGFPFPIPASVSTNTPPNGN